MNTFPIMWTDPMRQVLTELQQRPLLQQLLAFAQQRDVELYAVGGTLRDLCLGRPAQDVDLAMMGDVMRFAKDIANYLGAAYVPMDAAREEARVVYRKRESLDFARFKGDNIIADLRHRDFTINAMACPLATLLTRTAPEIIDPYSGWHDMRARCLRMVSPLSFSEDPLRLLRAFRFAANLEFAIDAGTLAAMETVAPRLRHTAAQRIHSELLRLFAAPSSGPYIVTMARLGLLDRLFPELAAIRSISCRTGDHGDMFEDSIRTYQMVERLINNPGSHLSSLADDLVEYLQREDHTALIKCAALLHAIGKSAMPREAAPAEAMDYGYPQASAASWEQLGSRLKLSRQRIQYVKLLIAHQTRPLQLTTLEAQARPTLRLIHRWSKELGDDMLGVFLLAVGRALIHGRIDAPVYGALAIGRCAAGVWEIYRRRILPVTTGPRFVTGDDLQQIFHLTPGPRFKILLEELEMAQVEGRIHTRSEALRWVEERLMTA